MTAQMYRRQLMSHLGRWKNGLTALTVDFYGLYNKLFGFGGVWGSVGGSRKIFPLNCEALVQLYVFCGFSALGLPVCISCVTIVSSPMGELTSQSVKRAFLTLRDINVNKCQPCSALALRIRSVYALCFNNQ